MVFLLGVLPSAAYPCNIHPVYSLAAVRGAMKIVHAHGRYEASSPIAFRVHEVTGAVIVSVEPGLLDHVLVHQIIAQLVARSSGGTVKALGSSAQQARSRLADGIAKMTSDQNAELQREERTYDTVTDNGSEQSQGPSYGLPGGPDVRDPACTR